MPVTKTTPLVRVSNFIMVSNPDDPSFKSANGLTNTLSLWVTVATDGKPENGGYSEIFQKGTHTAMNLTRDNSSPTVWRLIIDLNYVDQNSKQQNGGIHVIEFRAPSTEWAKILAANFFYKYCKEKDLQYEIAAEYAVVPTSTLESTNKLLVTEAELQKAVASHLVAQEAIAKASAAAAAMAAAPAPAPTPKPKVTTPSTISTTPAVTEAATTPAEVPMAERPTTQVIKDIIKDAAAAATVATIQDFIWEKVEQLVRDRFPIVDQASEATQKAVEAIVKVVTPMLLFIAFKEKIHHSMPGWKPEWDEPVLTILEIASKEATKDVMKDLIPEIMALVFKLKDIGLEVAQKGTGANVPRMLQDFDAERVDEKLREHDRKEKAERLRKLEAEKREKSKVTVAADLFAPAKA